MKARTAINLQGGARIKMPLTLDEFVPMYANMLRSKPGSAFEIEKITDHGAIKRVFVPVGLITYIEEL